MIVQIADAISEPDCRHLIGIHERRAGGQEIRDVCFKAADISDVVVRLVSACVDRSRAALGVSGRLYPETVLLAKLSPGMGHDRHADNCRQDHQGNWVPNHTPHRDVSAIYYLNEDFEGGELVFERLTITPHRGLLVIFPSDQHHVHEVRPVVAGARYTMPIWMTKNPARQRARMRSTGSRP